MTHVCTDFRTGQSDRPEKLPHELALALGIRNDAGWTLANGVVKTELKWIFTTASVDDLDFEWRALRYGLDEAHANNPGYLGSLLISIHIYVGSNSVFCLEWHARYLQNLLKFEGGSWEATIAAFP